MKTRKEFTPRREASEAQTPGEEPRDGSILPQKLCWLPIASACRQTFSINKPHNRAGWVSATPLLLFNTPGLECFAHPVGTWGRIHLLSPPPPPVRHSCKAQNSVTGLLPKLHPLPSGEAARLGMLGEPLSAHLACHLPTGPASPHHNSQCMFLIL